MRYQIIHETIYGYESPVVLSQQLLHLTPRPLPFQARGDTYRYKGEIDRALADYDQALRVSHDLALIALDQPILLANIPPFPMAPFTSARWTCFLQRRSSPRTSGTTAPPPWAM